MEKKYQIDYQDSKAMWGFQMETLKIADQYAESRKKYALNQRILKVGLAKAYANNKIERKFAEDKAYLILAEEEGEYRTALMLMIEAEGDYKAFEKVLEARQSALSFNQSLIKNQNRQT